VVAGYSGNIPSGGENFAVVRYTSSGQLDTSFNQTGIVVTDFGDSLDYAYAVTIQQVGSVEKIIVAGRSWNEESGDNLVLARYNADGSLDESLGSGGVLTSGLDGSTGACSMMFQADGRLLVVGGVYGDFALARYFVQF
jgi:uncharacterized delta-60 repeat protein